MCLVDIFKMIQVEGMAKPCSGAVDKTLPKEIMWKTFPHRLFFGRDFSKTWGPGGVAFVNPESNIQENVYMCLYKITYIFCSSLFGYLPFFFFFK